MSSIDVDTLLDALRGRRSIRSFAAESLPPGTEEKLVTALRWAPSAGNAQPYHFVLVYDEKTKRRIALAALSQQFIADPVELQRHLSLTLLNQLNLAIVFASQPHQKVDGVPDCRREQHQSYMLRQQCKRKFPNDTTLGIVEIMELVHHYR